MLRSMVFEDSQYSRFVNIVKEVYTGTDVEVYGSSGGLLLFNKSKDVYNERKGIVFSYIDFVPNNKDTVESYITFCNNLIEFQLCDRIALIPIPCAEYQILKVYDEITMGNDSIFKYSGNNTYEVFLKGVSNRVDCFKKKNIAGCKFYTTDCIAKEHRHATLLDKKIRIVETLPVYMACSTPLRDISSSLINGIYNAINTCILISDMIGADTKYCREVLNMNPLLRIK